jgi:hypothetical protein
MIKEKKKTLFVSDNFLVCCHVLQISKYCMYNVKKLRKKSYQTWKVEKKYNTTMIHHLFQGTFQIWKVLYLSVHNVQITQFNSQTSLDSSLYIIVRSTRKKTHKVVSLTQRLSQMGSKKNRVQKDITYSNKLYTTGASWQLENEHMRSLIQPKIHTKSLK